MRSGRLVSSRLPTGFCRTCRQRHKRSKLRVLITGDLKLRNLIRNLFRSEKTTGEHREHERVDARRGLRILVVDDSPTVTTVLSRMLQLAGYEALTAPDGPTALDMLAAEQPDLVFLDIVLPGMSGFAVLRAIRRKPETQSIPVIMISGNLKATEEFYGQRIGADDFIKKPFGRSEVFSRIERLVAAGRLPARDGTPVLEQAIARTPDQAGVLVADDANLPPGPEKPEEPAR